MIEAISSKNYLVAFIIVMAALFGIVVYSSLDGTGGASESWKVMSPEIGYVARDEFVPVSFSYTPSSEILGSERIGNFWLVLVSKKNGEKYLLPFYPREIPDLIERDSTNAVHFGKRKGNFAMNTQHDFSGYAYLSPLIFDGEYSLHVAFGVTEKGKSPTILSQDVERSFEVNRIFQARKSIVAKTLSNDIEKYDDGTYRLLRFSLSAVVDTVILRALEAGIPGIRRVPDPVMELFLYDAKTGEKVSNLTNMKLGAKTIERFTPYVLDSTLLVNVLEPREYELRATIDPARLDSNGNISFSIPRLYGINTEQQETPEQVDLKVTGFISR